MTKLLITMHTTNHMPTTHKQHKYRPYMRMPSSQNEQHRSQKSPTGFYSQIVSRSGLASKHQLSIPTGTIDRDYTGPIYVILQNNGPSTFRVTTGMRIAQLIMQPYCTPNMLLNSQPPETT
eukprot:10917966-Ditylum_brightwellii.AAC.1